MTAVKLIKGNVERVAEGNRVQQLMGAGFRPLSVSEAKTADTDPAKDIDEMTVPELKALAKAKGMEGYNSLTKQELLEILKG